MADANPDYFSANLRQLNDAISTVQDISKSEQFNRWDDFEGYCDLRLNVTWRDKFSPQTNFSAHAKMPILMRVCTSCNQYDMFPIKLIYWLILHFAMFAHIAHIFDIAQSTMATITTMSPVPSRESSTLTQTILIRASSKGSPEIQLIKVMKVTAMPSAMHCMINWMRFMITTFNETTIFRRSNYRTQEEAVTYKAVIRSSDHKSPYKHCCMRQYEQFSCYGNAREREFL